MPIKDLDKRREYQRRWAAKRAEANRSTVRRNRRSLVESRTEWINSLKINQPCQDCGNSFHPVAMDYDHRPGEHKVAGVCRMVFGGWSKTSILNEIAKCDLVCANCHRVRTYTRTLDIRANVC